MYKYAVFLILIVFSKEIAAYIEALAANYDPVKQQHAPLYVATICDDKHKLYNMYMNSHHEWVTDKDTNDVCTKSKADILKYCQKVYPGKDIRNIVESTHHFTIDNWCRVGERRCNDLRVVRPYRCLKGEFESDALLVPQRCIFDHIHKQSNCSDFDSWNGAAAQRCLSKKKILRSFAMLKPCGIDIFSGVEFVCCPKSGSVDDKKKKMKNSEIDDSLENEIESAEDDAKNSKEDKTSPEYYFTHFDSKHEHEFFKKAEKKLEEIQHDKVTNMMKEWSDLVEKYQEMKQKDPKGAEKFKDETTKRFQKTVKAMEDEQSAEKSQLVNMHQQRITASINRKKKEAMSCYVKALDQSSPKQMKILRCLQKLIRALEKDRRHSLQHYHHILSKDIKKDDEIRAETLNHLSHVNKVVNQSISMLDRHPAIAEKLKPSIHEFWKDVRYRLESDLPSELIESLSKNRDDTVLQYYKHDVQTKLQLKKRRKEMALKKKQEFREYRQEKKRVEMNVGHKLDKFDPETMEDESVLDVRAQQIDPKPVVKKTESANDDVFKISHYQHNKVQQDEVTYSVRREEVGSSYVALTNNIAVALAFVGVALVVVIIVGVSVLRRRNRRATPTNQGFIEVNQAATPEERHVANMQVNGYENPTYKYFDKNN